MNYADAKEMKARLQAEMEASSRALKSFPANAMGITPDAVKTSPDFRAAEARFDKAFSTLRRFNGQFVKVFKKQIQAERRAA